MSDITYPLSAKGIKSDYYIKQITYTIYSMGKDLLERDEKHWQAYLQQFIATNSLFRTKALQDGCELGWSINSEEVALDNRPSDAFVWIKFAPVKASPEYFIFIVDLRAKSVFESFHISSLGKWTQCNPFHSDYILG
jgi:hypothetical protein